MYTSYFNLREIPFSIAPDPAYLYLSPRHQEALGHLLYGTGQFGGFVQLTGEVGTGKTTIIRTLLAQKIDKVNVAMIHNPRQNEQEFVQSICDELGIAYEKVGATLKTLVDALNAFLLEQHAIGRRTVLIIDEAQNLDRNVLEQVRLLTNLETSKEKLLRIMLVGQPELGELLGRPDLRQLSQRITARYHLTPLDSAETSEYIAHRLQVAGGGGELFSAAAVKIVHRYAGGVPRLINILCDRALLGAYSQNLRQVTPDIIHKSAEEALGITAAGAISIPQRAISKPMVMRRQTLPLRWMEITLASAALIVAALLLWQSWQSGATMKPTSTAVMATPKLAATTADITGKALAPTAVAAGPISVKPTTMPVAVAPIVVTPVTPLAALAPLPPRPPLAAVATPVPTADISLDALGIPLNAAVLQLSALWDKDFRPSGGEKLCLSLHRVRLECLKGHAEWSDLTAMNVPAVLTLSMGHGDLRYVLLRELSNNTATLATSRGPVRVPLARLDPLWSGEYLALWKRETDELAIGPGTFGSPILWLRRRLGERQGKPVGHPDDIAYDHWDENLRHSLVRYQSANGIRPDGVADARTLLVLSDRRGAPSLVVPK